MYIILNIFYFYSFFHFVVWKLAEIKRIINFSECFYFVIFQIVVVTVSVADNNPVLYRKALISPGLIELITSTTVSLRSLNERSSMISDVFISQLKQYRY